MKNYVCALELLMAYKIPGPLLYISIIELTVLNTFY